MSNASPEYTRQVVENLRDAIKKAVRDENTACYWDGMSGTREEAAASLAEALLFVSDLERIARQ